MNWSLMTKNPPIGVDVGERNIKAVQFSRAGGEWRIGAAACLPRLGAGDGIAGPEVRRLHEQLGESGFRGNQLVLAVPCDKLLMGIMELPPATSGAPIEMLARGELARMHKCDSQSFEMASWRLPSPARAANTTFVMGAACTHADADSLLDCFEGEGFQVERLEIQSQATARACSPLLGESHGLAGILDIGWTAPQLVLLYDGVVIYERRLPKSAYGAVVGEFAGELEISLAEAEQVLRGGAGSADAAEPYLHRYVSQMIEEMRIPMSYVSNQYPDATTDQLLLIGGGAKLAGLEERLAEKMNWPVRVVEMSDLANGSESLDREHGSSLVVAAGLAWTMED